MESRGGGITSKKFKREGDLGAYYSGEINIIDQDNCGKAELNHNHVRGELTSSILCDSRIQRESNDKKTTINTNT